MKEEEKKVAMLDSIILERRKKCREELGHRRKCREQILRRSRKGFREESMLSTTLLKAADKHMKKIMDEEDYVPAIGVSIGEYSRLTGKDITVRACFRYKWRDLYWEIIEGPLRRRLCVSWDDIAGLELKLNECGLACLTVEVNRRPSFGLYKPEFKRWSSIANFTGDKEIEHKLLPQHVVFKPGTVDECYEKLLNYRKELGIVKKKHLQRVQKQLLRLEKEMTLTKNLHQFLESKRHRQLEKEENK